MSNPNLAQYQVRFSATNQPKNNGRKPSKLRKFIKDNNLGATDIQAIAKHFLGKTKAELKALAEDDNQPILLSCTAKALLEDLSKGNIHVEAWLIDRAFGRAVQAVDIKDDRDPVKKMTREEQDAYLKEWLDQQNKKTT